LPAIEITAVYTDEVKFTGHEYGPLAGGRRDRQVRIR